MQHCTGQLRRVCCVQFTYIYIEVEISPSCHFNVPAHKYALYSFKIRHEATHCSPEFLKVDDEDIHDPIILECDGNNHFLFSVLNNVQYMNGDG